MENVSGRHALNWGVHFYYTGHNFYDFYCTNFEKNDLNAESMVGVLKYPLGIPMANSTGYWILDTNALFG